MRSTVLGVAAPRFGDHLFNITIGRLAPLDLLTGDLQPLTDVLFVQRRLDSLLNQEKYLLAPRVVNMKRLAFAGEGSLPLLRSQID